MNTELTTAGSRPPARRTGTLILPLFLANFLAVGCSLGPDPRSTVEPADSLRPPSRPAETSTATAPSPARTADPPAAGQTPITITIAKTVIMARLADNPTARDLAAQLPLTLNFTDLNHVEKIARLPGPLTLQGAPAGADPDPGDIGYYAPSGDLVLYYGEVGYWNGIIRIGQLDTTTDLVEGPDGFQATIERA